MGDLAGAEHGCRTLIVSEIEAELTRLAEAGVHVGHTKTGDVAKTPS